MKQCTECGEAKPLDEFYKNKGMRCGRVNQCKTCLYVKQKARRDANRDEYLAASRQYTQASKDAKRAYDSAYREANRERLLASKRGWYEANRERHLELGRAWRKANPQRVAETDRAYHQRRRDALRAAAFGHYGECCACCGSTRQLTIDHINGDGRAHRDSLSSTTRLTGQAFYFWLLGNGFPEGFQTLCAPCNVSKGTGECCRLVHAEWRTG